MLVNLSRDIRRYYNCAMYKIWYKKSSQYVELWFPLYDCTNKRSYNFPINASGSGPRIL